MTTLKQFLCELADQCYPRSYFNEDSLRNATQLGDGCSRIVYRMEFEGREIAVKFANNDDYARNNRREYRNYRDMPQAVRDLMAEVFEISTCGRVIAFELIPYTLYDSPDHEDDYANHGIKWNENLRKVLEAHGFSGSEVSQLTYDNHNKNIGVRENGDIVWLDYATA